MAPRPRLLSREFKILRQALDENHVSDHAGHPAGGTTTALGLGIRWQDGPLAVAGVHQEPNGCFVETVLAAALGRLEYYQRSKFVCPEHELAIQKIEEALLALERRTRRRTAAGKEGTCEI
jgi:hypothetical protein